MSYAVQSTTEGTGTGGGPRITFLDNASPNTPYMVIGAYNGINNVVNGTRPLLIVANAGISIQGLTPPPAGVNTVDLVVDPATGRIYRQN